MIRTSATGVQYQNVFCKQVMRSGKGKNAGREFVNYVGYFTIGNKVFKLSVTPEITQGNNGQDGVFCTVVATNLVPRNNRGGGAKF